MRVVVTGLGTINCLGKNCNEFWDNLKAGKNGIGDIADARFQEIGLTQGGYIQNFNPEDYNISNELDRTIQFGLIASEEAVKDSGLKITEENRYRIGVSVGTSIGGYIEVENYLRSKKDNDNFENDKIMQIPAALTAGFIAKKFRVNGPNMTVVTACAAGGNSIGYGLDMIRSGQCDVVIAGGSDPLSFMSQTGFSIMKVLSKNYCRPFNKEKTGILIGEGSVFMILENLEHARVRNAKIYAELMGYGLSNDAYHVTSPDPKGGGAIRSMTMALQDAGLSPDDIDYINAHGTGTKFNDIMELNAINEVFKEKAKSIPVSSIKGALGHTLGLAGSIEALATVLGIYYGILPPTAMLEEPMEEGYDFVPNCSKEAQIRCALTNSFAFGGNTVTLAFGKNHNMV